eukprot:2520588-Rhodomonas_salina.1
MISRTGLAPYAPATPCPVQTNRRLPIFICPSYAVSGTDCSITPYDLPTPCLVLTLHMRYCQGRAGSYTGV